MDETQAELRRLKLGMRTWMLKAVKLAFGPAAASAAVECAPPSASKLNGVFSPGAATLMAQLRSHEAGGTEEEALLQRPEVIQFIEAINASIKEKVSGFSPSPRKVRLSLGMNPALRAGAGGLGSPGFASPRRQNRLSVLRRVDTPSWMPPLTAEKDEPFVGHGRESILFGLDLNSALEAAGNNVSDSQVLIERMLDVINEEKRILGHQLAAKDARAGDAATVATESTGGGDATAANDSDDGCGEDEEDEEELKAVDKLIAEKEEILTKLMENIKGYSALKAEFEKLVEAINGLETEKKELEAELEKAKKSNQSSAQLEKIKERFTTVKEELRRMKDDRKNKEQAYKMMQKESKALDTMQRELQKLKESKVSLLKQQKTQFNELQKMKKEQAVKLQLLKKSDVKKQQQMNALKSELVKKERIIGHRDKEIGRMAMKLRACEDHITQLLKIQNRSRQKGAAASGSGAAAGASSRNLRGLAAASAVPLDGAEAEHLATSKGVLDQAVLAQVDRRVTRLLYEKKTAVLRKLNQALVAEAADLEALLASRQALLDEHAAAAPEADAEGGAAAHAMAPEKKVLLETCEQSVKLAEAKVERLTKEIDLFNADIDDLSLQLEKIEKPAGADAAAGTVWDTIGTEIVLGLSAPQAQALLLDSIAEKVTLSTALRTAEAEVALLLAKVEDEAAMKLLLAAHVEELRAAHRERLVQLEKQRLEDVWAMMKASSGAAGAAADDLQQGVLFQKARALELQLEDETTRLGDASAQLATAQEQLGRQSRQLAEMEMRLQVAARVSAAANDSNAAQGGSASGFLDAEYLKRLQQLWEDTGLALDERHVVMDCLLKSQELAKERALSDAERALRAATEDFAAREASVQRLLAALGDAADDAAAAVAPPDWAQLRALPKIAAVARLDALQEALAARFDGRAPQLRALRDQLDYYVAEMWLQREDLPPALQQLARLPSTAQEAQWERDGLVALMAQHALSLSALAQWHDELKALNLQRVRATASLIALRDQCLALCAELGLLQPGDAELAQLLEQVFGEDADVPPRARSATVQILTQQTSSNPPGAQTLLVAFDKLKLLLESVRLNRSTVSALLCRLHGRFVDVFRDTSANAPASLAEACDRACVEAQTQSVVDLAAQLAQLKQTLGDEVCEAAAQLSGDRPTAAQLATSVARNVEAITAATAPCLQQLDETVEELGGMEVFVEEAWLQRRVALLLRVLPRAEPDGLAALARDCLHLKSEKKRLETLRETFGELQRTDAQLVRHIAELEDFEERSKADRAKALSGSSKMLVEEEKFRRNGKKKYEAISEKLLALHAKLLALLGSASTTATASPLEVRLSFNGLSGPGQCLLRGGVSKERVELMRLHTAAAAAAAATALTSPTHAPSAAAAAAAAAPRRSSDNASAKSSAGSAKSGSSKENAAGAANRSQLPVVGGKGALKSASAASRARAAPKTTGHQPVSASSALSSLASLAIENPLTFAAELGSGATPKAEAAAGRRYSFQPPTPPQTHVDASDSSREASPAAADEAADQRALWSQIDTVTPSLAAEDL